MRTRKFKPSPPTPLRARRLLLGISQDCLWLATGVHQPHLSKIERGLASATLEQKRRLAEALGASVEELFPGA